MNLMKLSLVLLAGVTFASGAMAAKKVIVGSTSHTCPVGTEFAKDKEKDQDAVSVNLDKDELNWTGTFHVENGQENFPTFEPKPPKGAATVDVSPTLKPYLEPGSEVPAKNVVPASYKITCNYKGGDGANYDDGLIQANWVNNNWNYGCYIQPGTTETIACW